MVYYVLDLEADGLLDEVTKVYCLSYQKFDKFQLIKQGTLTTESSIREFFSPEDPKILFCHNIVDYDIPLIKLIYGIDMPTNYTIYDSLAISFGLYPIKGFLHGLGEWGVRVGIPKPLIDDWKNLTLKEYIHRCEEDVEINVKVIHHMIEYCLEIYEDIDAVLNYFSYLTFKQYCLEDQKAEKIKLDVSLAEKNLMDLEFFIDEKITILSAMMPPVLDKKNVMPKSGLYLKGKSSPKLMLNDPNMKKHGRAWMQKLHDRGLPLDSTEIYLPGNPGSSPQLKAFLYLLGWIPELYEKNDKGEDIAKVSLPFGKGLCPSVKKLFPDNPGLEQLDSLYKARHRKGLLKAFLESKDEDGYIIASAFGYTNTLRMAHKRPVANLPKPSIWYGKEIRGCLTIPDDSYIMIGSDISGLEDNTKQHYIYYYDPKYVTEMRVPGFDAHVDIAVLADLLTREDEKFFRWYEAKEDEARKNKVDPDFTEEQLTRMKAIKKVRGGAKQVNFSATYGAGAPKLAKSLDCTLEFAQVLHKTYWTRNKAIKQTANDATVKVIRGQKWIYNPVSKFWLFLKSEKDRFSTLNQSTGRHYMPLYIEMCK